MRYTKPLKKQKSHATGLRRPCRQCSKYYYPSGKYQKYCNKCLEERKNKRTETIKQKRQEGYKYMHYCIKCRTFFGIHKENHLKFCPKCALKGKDYVLFKISPKSSANVKYE